MDYYPRVVRALVVPQNAVSIWNVERVEESRYAIPVSRWKEILGETSMSWTAFAATMEDGKEFSFGTTWNRDFFHMPAGYSAKQIRENHPHRPVEKPIYYDKPFFECFLDGVQLGKYRG